ncbi:efflux transporter outer membrane subunit [Glaciimonas immobilis]|uniref:NodT family efflux transporter outer membrane factor (OMF) lipoprotein n=1 Tax=Glaciimonas immobilis TaxID=728004 RepID=A0A840RZ11_9BURK|nr:efflux transporter outer membrane subunit [Glaciimonas immobilis]KAF3998416.1 efflux transporter outer membrane subunit [Glaciimonas immobilis]MBB5202096.1 NodT family efflux transporter outer membrane factor (OMF) lipoprotein [Glaciimonas immobilis]
MKHISKFALAATVALSVTLLSACAVGPDYVRPTMETPTAFKESKDWKVAEPRDHELGDHWWEGYNDPILNALITQIEISNQNLAQAEAKYRQASALVQQSRAAYFPTVGASLSASRSGGRSINSRTTTTASSNGSVSTSHSLSLNASWEADLWGRIRRTVESNQANAQFSAANLQGIKLSAQSALAQDYWQLRILDAQKILLQDTVAAYQKSFQLTQNQYAAGIVSQSDVIQAQTQLKSAQAQMIDLGVQRAKTEHAIALLIGQPASTFYIAPAPLAAMVPAIPVGVPSALLERRPDISAAERLAAAANAQIGVAKAAYFPSLILSATGGLESNSFANWLSLPNRVWSLGPALAQTIFDGGARKSQTDQAIANYDGTVAAYKQAVLTSFQEVEDNLATLRILEEEALVQDETVQSARKSVSLILNQYKAGLVNYTSVATVQATALSAENSALSILNRRMAASVQLIAALGGGWNQAELSGNAALSHAQPEKASAAQN